MMLLESRVYKYHQFSCISVLTTDGDGYSLIGNYNEVSSKKEGGKK